MIVLPNENTKPSRINRKRKRGWKIGAGLTGYSMAAILYPLSQKTKVGIQTPRIGRKRPLSTVVFLYPPKTQAVLHRLLSVLVGCIEQPLKRLAGSYAGSLNLIQSTAQRIRLVGGGYFPFYIGLPR